MNKAVPEEDLPSNLVPEDDLPDFEQKEDPRKAMLRAMSGPLGRATEEGVAKVNKFLEHAGYHAGGAVTDVAAKMFPPEAAAGAGVAANLAISEGIPAAVGGAATRTIFSPAFRGAGQFLMRQALKPSWREMLPGGTGQQAIQTMLNRRLEGNILPGENVSAGGVYNLEHHLNDIRDKIVDIARQPIPMAEKLREIRPVWESGKELYDAYKIAQRRVSGTSLPGGFPYWWLHRPKVATAYMAAHSPTTTSLAARMLNAGQNYIPFTAGAAIHGAAGASQALPPYEQEPYQTLEGRLP